MSFDYIEQDDLSRAYEQTVEALVAAASQRDKQAEGHSQRVTRYSLAIGRVLGCSREELINLKYAAGLHDIGKIAISRKLLNKMGRLSEEEFAVMKQHSAIAIRILERIDGMQQAIPLIKHHHERYDGTGYPDGLSREEIPLGSRIIAVAEAFDILTTDVPWRDALHQNKAIEEIESCSGTQFDPKIVEAFKIALTTGIVER